MKAKVAAVALAGLALFGCTLAQTSLRERGLGARVGKNTEMLAPNRCLLRVIVAARPEGGDAFGEAIWRIADEQAIDSEVRRTLQANGLRVGRISGELPAEVQAALAENGPRKAEVQTVVLPEGENTLIDPGTPSTPALSVILDQKGKAVGKNYEDVRGFVRMVASFDGPDGIAVRLIPELHHGPDQRNWGVAGGPTPSAPRQFVVKNGQKEESFRDMAGTIVLRPGQIAVIGGRPERRGSLGDFLFGEPEGNSDRPLRKVVLIWATRSDGRSLTDTPAGLVPIDPTAETAGAPKPAPNL